MLNLPVYLYTPVIRVFLDLGNSTKHGVDMMYHGYAKIAKGVTNTLQFNFLNGDQRPIDVTGKTFVFKMFDYTTNKEVVSKNLTIVDDGETFALKGKTSLTLTSNDIGVLFKPGLYTYSILRVQDTQLMPTYIDGASELHGKIEVIDGVVARFVPSDELVFLQSPDNVFTAGPISTNRDGKGTNSLHTIQAYFTDFTGDLEIKGSLSNTPPITWEAGTTIAVRSFTDQTGSVGITVDDLDNVNYLMFRYTKNIGSIDKVLYRS